MLSSYLERGEAQTSPWRPEMGIHFQKGGFIFVLEPKGWSITSRILAYCSCFWNILWTISGYPRRLKPVYLGLPSWRMWPHYLLCGASLSAFLTKRAAADLAPLSGAHSGCGILICGDLPGLVGQEDIFSDAFGARGRCEEEWEDVWLIYGSRICKR